VKPFAGSYGVLVTPFTEKEQELDIEALKGLLDWQISCGSPGVILLGTTGEFLTITDSERTEIVKASVQHVAGRMDVLVGTMNAATKNATRYSKEAEDLGADGLMILPPYYYTPTESEITKYYESICKEVSLPIMIYNNPFTSNVDMSAKFVGQLTKEFDNIRYIKEASMDLGRIPDIIEYSDGLMHVFAGERVVDSYLLGATGYVNPYANYIPEASTEICNLLAAGEIEQARRLGQLIAKIDHIIAQGHPTYGHQCYSKALAARRGYPVGDVRPPLTTFAELGAEGVERVGAIMPLISELNSELNSEFNSELSVPV